MKILRSKLVLLSLLLFTFIIVVKANSIVSEVFLHPRDTLLESSQKDALESDLQKNNPSEDKSIDSTQVSDSELISEHNTRNNARISSIEDSDITDTVPQRKVNEYIRNLGLSGFPPQNQGVWIQTENSILAKHQESVLLPAASVTKVATTLAALVWLEPEYRFITKFLTNGVIESGVLQGDLIVAGSADPFFVWEEAIHVGNALNKIGISTILGDLIITGPFYMNWEENPQVSGSFLKSALDYETWSAEAFAQYQAMPPNTAKPQISITGDIRLSSLDKITEATLLVEHDSLPIVELLKKMNNYSNNAMAEMIANYIGGPDFIKKVVIDNTGIDQSEISLINGSGLGDQNLMSPRAACRIFLAIQTYLNSHSMNIADVLTVVGQDESILDSRVLPQGAVLKSGTLNNASVIAGALPTRDIGVVWFSVMNGGSNLNKFRTEQEFLLKSLSSQWGIPQDSLDIVSPDRSRYKNTSTIRTLG